MRPSPIRVILLIVTYLMRYNSLIHRSTATANRSRLGDAHCPPSLVILAILAFSLLSTFITPASVLADDTPQLAAPTPAASIVTPTPELQPVLAAGDRDALWVVIQNAGKFQLLFRNLQSPPGSLYVATESAGRVRALAADPSLAYILYDSDLLQSIRYLPPTPNTLAAFDVQQLPPLPTHSRILDIAAGPQGLYILALAPPASASLSTPDSSSFLNDIFDTPDNTSSWLTPPTPAPNPSTPPKPADEPSPANLPVSPLPTPDSSSPDSSPTPPTPIPSPNPSLTIFHFSSAHWLRIPAPDSLSPSDNLRLSILNRQPVILQLVDASLTLHHRINDQWSAQTHPLTLAPDFRALNIDHHLLVIDRSPTPAGSSLQLHAHLFFDNRWLDAGSLPLPPGKRIEFLPTNYDNQLSILLAAAPPSASPDAPPALSLLQRNLNASPDSPPAVTDLKISQWPTPPVNRDLLVFGLFGVAMLIMLSVWRRDAASNTVKLPPTLIPAEISRRSFALLIDLLPGYFLLYLLAGSSDPLSLVLRYLPPNLADYAQWLLMLTVTLLMTTHVTLCELFTGRSLGKLIFRIRVVSITGTPPNLWQILTRNLIRILELMVWPIFLIAALNPHHQRLGDLAAKTLVVRNAPPTHSPSRPTNE